VKYVGGIRLLLPRVVLEKGRGRESHQESSNLR